MKYLKLVNPLLCLAMVLSISLLPYNSVATPIPDGPYDSMPPHPDLLAKWQQTPNLMPALPKVAPQGFDQSSPLGASLSGSFKALLILVDFSDKTSTIAATYWDSLILGAIRPSVKTYYS